MKFTTFDQDNDPTPTFNCATRWLGAWWYGLHCFDSNLNGEYGNNRLGEGVNWRFWLDNAYSLKFTEMKLRPLNF